MTANILSNIALHINIDAIESDYFLSLLETKLIKHYMDHLTPKLTGIDALIALIKTSNEKVPGRTFDLLKLNTHNSTGLSLWRGNLPADSTIDGTDFIEFDSNNYITRIVGFF